MSQAFNSFISVVAMIAVCAAVVWLSNGAPMPVNIGGYTGAAVDAVGSVGMSTGQMMTGAAIVLIIFWAMSSLRTSNKKDGTK